MLSGTNAAPQLVNVVADNGSIQALVTDDGSGGTIEIKMDVDADGIADFFITAMEGDFINADLGTMIAPNQTTPVEIELVETSFSDAGSIGKIRKPSNSGSSSGTNADGQEDIVASNVTIPTPGRSVNPVSITSINAIEDLVIGTVDTTEHEVAGSVMIQWRAVGDTNWHSGSGVDGTGGFSLGITGTNGERDF